jgi:hypothetical protein
MKFAELKAQSLHRVIGVVQDESARPISFASVTIYSSKDSVLITGTITDALGEFEITHNKLGDYWLVASFMGYKPIAKKMKIQESELVNVGILVLQQSTIELSEVKVIRERLKAEQDLDKTTFYVNKKMQKASNTAIDVVKFVPGVEVDLLQNISLEGKQNLLVKVNGVERDVSFLNQLSSANIDKIEVDTNPGTKYSSEVSGVINVILKKDKKEGMSGHIYVEIPTNSNEVYSFPSANINYTLNKLNIFSSYQGEFSYFDIDAHSKRSVLTPDNQFEISNQQSIQQKNWSHKFNLGFDYFFDSKNQLNFYAFLNPYSNEHDGTVSIDKIVGDINIKSDEFIQDDKDINSSAFASIYYKHIFEKPGKELDFEVNFQNFKAQNSTYLYDKNSEKILINTLQPVNLMINARVDFSLPIKSGLKLETGLEENIQILGDRELSSFNYREVISAAHASLFYTKPKFQVKGGIRLEYADITSAENQKTQMLSFLPNLTAKYDLSKKSSINLSYRKSLLRPHMYQLNPNSNYVDPYTIQQGNPLLNPDNFHDITLDYSTSLNNNFISVGTYYSLSSDVIEKITLLNSSMIFDIKTQNLGDITQFGVKLLGSLKPHKNISFNPFLKVFHVQTQGNEIAKANKIEDKNMMALESGLSMAMLFKHDIAFSLMYRYKSANVKIQNKYFDDVLYFISLEKTFFENLKFGITSAIPLKRSFTYQGYESMNSNFNVNVDDNIRMSVFPVWLKIKYSFASGKKVDRINRENAVNEKRIKKGF